MVRKERHLFKRILEALPLLLLTVVSKMDVFPVVLKNSILSPSIVFSNSRSVLIRARKRITFTATVPNNAPPAIAVGEDFAASYLHRPKSTLKIPGRQEGTAHFTKPS
jgi:hypothetical protein